MRVYFQSQLRLDSNSMLHSVVQSGYVCENHKLKNFEARSVQIIHSITVNLFVLAFITVE